MESRGNGRTRRASLSGHRWQGLIPNVVFAWSILIPLFLPSLFRLPEFAPPQVVYARDITSLLLSPWTFPSTVYRVFSRLLQSVVLSRLHKNAVLPCYLFSITIGLTRTLIGFLLTRSVGWTYPHLFNHWALYESIGGCGPALVAYLLASGARPDLASLFEHLRGYRWEFTDSLVLLVVCTLLTALDRAPWSYGIAIALAIVTITLQVVFTAFYPPVVTYAHLRLDSRNASPQKLLYTDIRISLLLFIFVPIPSILSALLTSPSPSKMPTSSEDGAPLLDILLLSYPRPNDTPSSPDHSILSETIASYLPYVSSSTTLSVFSHAQLSLHPAFTHAERQYQNARVTFYADMDAHPDAYDGQHLHLSEALWWVANKGDAEWVMLVEDDFPLCGEWGWRGVLGVMHLLVRGHEIPSPETTKMWGGFVATGGSGLILHRTLLPILSHVLRLYALANSPFPPFMPRRPPDIIIQDCLLGLDPLCPTAPSPKDNADGPWIARRRPTMVITSRLVMDHVGGRSSTAQGRAYDVNKWRCGWRHPFHGRPEVSVVPV